VLRVLILQAVLQANDGFGGKLGLWTPVKNLVAGAVEKELSRAGFPFLSIAAGAGGVSACMRAPR
jgi:hypothetical protein